MEAPFLAWIIFLPDVLLWIQKNRKSPNEKYQSRDQVDDQHDQRDPEQGCPTDHISVLPKQESIPKQQEGENGKWQQQGTDKDQNAPPVCYGEESNDDRRQANQKDNDCYDCPA